MSNTTHTLRRTGTRTAGLTAAVVGLMALGGGTAFAHHPEITATAACDGKISFTATAWNGDSAASRTNDNIAVYKKVGTGELTEVGTGAFTGANSFTFSGTFTLAAPQPSAVTVSVEALGPWGTGAAAGDGRSVVVTLPTGCVVVPVETPAPPVETPVPPVETPVPPVVEVDVPVAGVPVVETPVVETPVVETPDAVVPAIRGVARNQGTVEGAVLPHTGGGAPIGLMVALGLGLSAGGAAAMRAARQ